MESGHGNNHFTIPHFHRNTKGFLLHALPLPPLPKRDLRPELSDRKFVLSYFFMINRSINLIYPPLLLGGSLDILMDINFSLHVIVTNSLSNAVSNSFKTSILNYNWRKKYTFCMHVWSENIQHVSIDSTRHCILLTAQPITQHKCKELPTENL